MPNLAGQKWLSACSKDGEPSDKVGLNAEPRGFRNQGGWMPWKTEQEPLKNVQEVAAPWNYLPSLHSQVNTLSTQKP